jgi:hypothetical protein
MTPLTLALAVALAADPAPAARLDALGDPLPPGAVMRLGTLRHRIVGFIDSHNRAYLDGGRTLLFAGYVALLWTDAETGREIDRWAWPAGLQFAGLSPDGRRLVLTDQHMIRAWDVPARRELRTIAGPEGFNGYVVATFSPDSRFVALEERYAQGGLNRIRVRLWDLTAGRELWWNDQVLNAGWTSGVIGFGPGGRALDRGGVRRHGAVAGRLDARDRQHRRPLLGPGHRPGAVAAGRRWAGATAVRVLGGRHPARHRRP